LISLSPNPGPIEKRIRIFMTSSKLRIIPLGGLGEVGKNMTVFEYGRNILLIDAGVMFPENDMLGVDLIIPDFGYLLDKKEQVRAIIVTHGHEDHTGGLPYVLKEINAPIYTTRLTRGLIEVKLRQHKLLEQATIHTIEAGDQIAVGPFGIEFYHVCHSIPDGVGLGITTPLGLIVHSGDYKFDHTPVDDWPTDFAKLAEFAGRGVLALLSDSTNAERPGWTPSERTVEAALDEVFRQAPGRVIVATFASLVSRVQMVLNAAQRYGRKVAIAGYSMSEYVRIAKKLGYLNVPADLIIPVNDVDDFPPSKVAIMATGTQGEPSAVLGRLATDRHRQLYVQQGDTVVMSAHPIPGNEELVHRIINRLLQRGAHVLYDAIAPVHVSGHASREEQKLLLNTVRPEYFIPIHGELRMLHQHAAIARELGIPAENIAVVENGTIIEFDEGGMTIGERVPGGYVFIDGAMVGDIGPAVLRDRERLARDGFVAVLVNRDAETGTTLGWPRLVSRGFVYLPEADELIEAAEDMLASALADADDASRQDLERLIQKRLGQFLYGETKRRPMIIPTINDITL
jgi:ribonuclease J